MNVQHRQECKPGAVSLLQQLQRERVLAEPVSERWRVLADVERRLHVSVHVVLHGRTVRDHGPVRVVSVPQRRPVHTDRPGLQLLLPVQAVLHGLDV